MIRDNRKYADNEETLAGNPLPEPGAEPPMPPEEAAPVAEKVKATRKTSKSRKAVQDFLGGDYLSREWVTGNLAFIFYLAFLGMIYIANTYYTEKKFKAIERTKVELKELRYEYITTKATLMFQGRQSEISRRALAQGLRETTMPPYKILYSGESLKNSKP
ncbi:MAG TPA: FtsL-like putative cell division protein [Bacteroidales bacterium]|nr:FtsL-like putative cell division protein [Bacteroidales bacterium]